MPAISPWMIWMGGAALALECLKPYDHMAKETDGLDERVSRSERASLHYADQLITLGAQHRGALERISVLEAQNRELLQRQGYERTPPMSMPAAD
ncbi:hypothetical protein F5883DRAFT_635995 [Diaporthe sp. PMI_573]|nr:hypothetical protein F5883DRAFT_635995 [Diaporthaceae sp. PMI_573]